MTLIEWISTVSAFTTILAFVGAVIARIFRAHTDKIINELTKEYLSELKPNHGSSLRDSVNAIKTDITDIMVNLAKLEGKFDQHIEENNH